MKDIRQKIEDSFKTTKMSSSTADTKYSSVFSKLKKENNKRVPLDTIFSDSRKGKSTKRSQHDFTCDLEKKRSKAIYSNRSLLNNIEKGVFDFYWNMKSIRQGSAAKVQQWMEKQRVKMSDKSKRL